MLADIVFLMVGGLKPFLRLAVLSYTQTKFFFITNVDLEKLNLGLLGR